VIISPGRSGKSNTQRTMATECIGPGMAAPKKLQDFLVDAHVPRPQRDSLPLFESERGVVWVGGLRIAEWAKPRRGRPRLYLSYRLVE